MTRINRRSALALILATTGASCAAPTPPQPTGVALRLTGGADMNGTRPAKVKVYYLNAVGAFDAADFFKVFDEPEEALGTDLIAVDAYAIAPGRILDVAKQFDAPPVALGIVAAFSNIDGTLWRATAPIQRHSLNAVAVSLAGNSVSAATQVLAGPGAPVAGAVPGTPGEQAPPLPNQSPLGGLGSIFGN